MSDNNNKENILTKSKKEWDDFGTFTTSYKQSENLYSFNFSGGGKEKPKNINNNLDDKGFYEKYNILSATSGPDPFELEKELANHIKLWHSIKKEYKVESGSSGSGSGLYQDDFFNEEYVLSNILGDQYIQKNYSIITFQLLDFVITELEKKVFDIELLQTGEPNTLLNAPLSDKGFIEFLLNNDIEEKLHNMYQGEKVGYSYVIEKIVVFDLFLIYIVLKNYPFYVLRRDRLEILFKSLKKYKSFPYPIGSIGMDLFKLLIDELYLPGVTIFQEVRRTMLIDLLDPNLIEVNPDDFIRVVSFEPKVANCKKNNKEDDNKKQKESNNNQSNTNFKLHDLKELTFTSLLVYAAYILYSSEDKKDSEKEEVYFENILALFEKRLRQKKDDSKNSKNKETINNGIFEKNIVNNIFNLIDEGLDSNYSRFKKEVKAVNDKLISKSKESHETTSSKPRDNIDLRRFLDHKIYSLKMPYKVKNKFNYKKNKTKDNLSQNTSSNVKKNMAKKADKNAQNLINGENPIDNEQPKENKEEIDNLKEIDKYKNLLLDETTVADDPILDDYIENFLKVRKDYFGHLQEFQVENYNFQDDKEKDNYSKEFVENFNQLTRIKEKQLTELYKQKYIVKENELIYFLKNLDVWKCNIRPYYHKKLKEQIYDKKEKKEEENEELKKNEKKDKESLNNDNNINIFDGKNIDISPDRNSILREEKKKIKYIVDSDLPFNYELFLIPGEAKKEKGDDLRPDNPLTKFISKQDFIYKSIIGDFFWALFNLENIDQICDQFVKTPIQLYLREAKHFYNLKVFQCKIQVLQSQTFFDELKIEGNFYYLYGSIHIESDVGIELQLDKETIVFTNEGSNIYIDIINIYNENEGGKINEIEKYLVNPNSNCFQVFVSAEKNGINTNIDQDKKDSNYFKKFVIPILNFDVKSMNYEAKKIIVRPINNDGSFRLTPTFLYNIPTEVSYFEIDYAPNNNTNREKLNENEELDLGVYSFDIQIKTFIDLYKSDD